MRREGSAAETYDTAETDLVEDGFVIFRDFSDKGIAGVDALGPFVTLDCDLDAGLHVSSEVLPWSDALDSTGN